MELAKRSSRREAWGQSQVRDHGVCRKKQRAAVLRTCSLKSGTAVSRPSSDSPVGKPTEFMNVAALKWSEREFQVVRQCSKTRQRKLQTATHKQHRQT